jgi:hypothetical protein
MLSLKAEFVPASFAYRTGKFLRSTQQAGRQLQIEIRTSV